MSLVILSVVPDAAGLAVIRSLLVDGRSRTVAVGSLQAALSNLFLNLGSVPVLNYWARPPQRSRPSRCCMGFCSWRSGGPL